MNAKVMYGVGLPYPSFVWFGIMPLAWLIWPIFAGSACLPFSVESTNDFHNSNTNFETLLYFLGYQCCLVPFVDMWLFLSLCLTSSFVFTLWHYRARACQKSKSLFAFEHATLNLWHFLITIRNRVSSVLFLCISIMHQGLHSTPHIYVIKTLALLFKLYQSFWSAFVCCFRFWAQILSW